MDGGAETVVDAFLNAVGPEGTEASAPHSTSHSTSARQGSELASPGSRGGALPMAGWLHRWGRVSVHSPDERAVAGRP
jgi:hypothetical protein